MLKPSKDNMIGKLLGASIFAGLLIAAPGMAQTPGPLKSLGGELVLDRDNTVPDVEKMQAPAGGFPRAYRQQPPLIPHKVDGYQIAATNNACLTCHDWPGNTQYKAPKVSETHYVDRQGVRLDKVAGTRYFCLQCHVPQADAKPLVKNVFEDATQVK